MTSTSCVLPPRAIEDASQPIPNLAIYDPERKLFRLKKSSGGTISKGAFGVHISCDSCSLPDGEGVKPPHQTEVVSTIIQKSKSECRSDDEILENELLREKCVIRRDFDRAEKKSTAVSEWYLFIEEAIYLHERGLLDVHNTADAKMESYDLYKLLPDHGMPMPVYLVYAHLRQQTFKVVRYSKERREIIKEQVAFQQGQQYRQNKEKTNDKKDGLNASLKEEDRRPNFGKRLRESGAIARPPPLNDVSRHLAWDVYPPDATYLKREPGLPAFSVLVTLHSSLFPVDFLRVLVQENDPIIIKVATVADTGTVILFGVTNIGAPPMVPVSSSTISNKRDREGHSEY